MAPEQEARAEIDKLLKAAGWSVQPRDKVNLTAAQGIAICEYPLKAGHGFADYLLYVDGAAVGVIEAKKAGIPLTAVELQTAKYSEGLPDHIPAPRRPLPFCYQSTGVETRFTNLLEPDARSRAIFAFHKPDTLSQWIQADLKRPGSTVRGRLRIMPPLDAGNLWPAQIKAIRNLEESLADNRPRALIQMATGSGKTFTACNFTYRLIQFAGAKRVLFLVDRKTLGGQTLNEFQQFVTPDEGRKFTELYNVQLLSSNKIDLVSKVCITTIQRLYSMLVGREIVDTEEEEKSAATWADLTKLPDPIAYNPAFPIETFDFIVTASLHSSRIIEMRCSIYFTLSKIRTFVSSQTKKTCITKPTKIRKLNPMSLRISGLNNARFSCLSLIAFTTARFFSSGTHASITILVLSQRSSFSISLPSIMDTRLRSKITPAACQYKILACTRSVINQFHKR